MAAVTKGAPECPVFRPTLAEVHGSSFVEYVEKLERSKAFREAGICKIVVPEGWSPRRQGYNRLNFDLPRPIRQHATGRQGLYRTLMVEAKKQMRLDEFRDMAREALNAAPKDAARGGAGERGEGPTVAEREGWADELERQFWRNVTLNPPLYGADIPGSLFDPGLKGWSLRRLRSLLSDTLEAHSIRMPGVNEPYLYVGSWRSLFAWHTEDMDLHSVNYLHCGASKQWYVVPPAHRQRFELLMRSLLQDLFRACPEFMRHKELLVSPQLLASHAIPVVRVVHNPREFVVVYPGAYHSGFNHGFNIAESVNFATKAWLPIGAAAGYCECTADSARIDMRLFREHMPPKLRREVENMYASSDDEDDDEESGEGASSDEEGGSAEESVGSESEEEASSSDVGEEDEGDEDQGLRKRQRQQRGAQRRQPAGTRRREGAAQEEEEAEEEVQSTSDWEPEEEAQRPSKRVRPADGAPAPAPAAPPLAKPGSPRPQRYRRPPSRDLDMAPVRLRPPSGGAGATAQQDGQRSGGAAAPPNRAAAAASRKRSLARSQQAKAGMPAALGAAAKQNVAVVGTSSRGRPLKLKLLSSLVSLLPLSHRR